ncbi:cytochrome P450 [Acrocarpospora catenulata]|uniref:cytochrome P450 n=1 Tax=Acrocarpospora catenulata TaxID=2836182 RepID=UPI001BDA6080|nr:cytochrome P450 [Acrocarpospora catenulata]
MKLTDIDVLNPEIYQNGLPHDQFAYLRQNAPCFLQSNREPGMIESGWIITRHSDVRNINRDAANYLNYKGVSPKKAGPTLKSGGKPAMTSLDGPEHHRNRLLVSQAFTRRSIKTFEDSFRDLAAEIVTKALEKKSFDFVHDVAVELPMQVICNLMGVPEEDRYKVLDWSNTIASPMDPEYSPSPEAQMEAVHGLWNYGLHLADLRRDDPGDDIMSKLTRAVDGDRLTNEELMGFTLLLIGAGNETTRNALSHGMHGLIHNPDQMAYLRRHLDRVPDPAVEEILRWSTPVVFMRRTAARDIELHGSTIKEGDAVIMMYGSANFDPDEFENPMSFDLTRSPNAHLTFGFGNHFCLGAFVARLEIRILLEEFLRRTSDVRLDAEPTYGRDCYFRPVKRMPVTVSPA